jgi:hypothetical protein
MPHVNKKSVWNTAGQQVGKNPEFWIIIITITIIIIIIIVVVVVVVLRNSIYFPLQTFRTYTTTFRSTWAQRPKWLFPVVTWVRAFQVLPEWFWYGSSWPNYYQYHFHFSHPHAPYLYCKLPYFKNIFGDFPNHNSVSLTCAVY